MRGCKNCPAYAKCTVTYRSSACEALRGTYGIDSDPEIATNADTIRGMSNECRAESYCYTGHTGMIDWLCQTAEEDT